MKIKEKLKKRTQALLPYGSLGMICEEFRDGKGNLLKAEEILFTDKEKKNFYRIGEDDVEPIFQEDSFPVAVKVDGKIMDQKISEKTEEELPIHAGCCPQLNIILVGAPGAGKTVYFLQLSDPNFHDMLSHHTTFLIRDDLPAESERRVKYGEWRREMKKNHILPQPTKKGETIDPYYFYVRYKEDGQIRRNLVKIDDISGEECTDVQWSSKIFHSNHFLLVVGADELLAAERGEEVQYRKVVSKLLPKLKMLRPDGDYKVHVVITKCDLLDGSNFCLKDEMENTIKMEGDHLRQTVHEEGFNHEVFQKKSEEIRNYLREECSSFYNELLYEIPWENLEFCMIASIGEAPEGNSYRKYQPRGIDEPFLSILAGEGLYPIKVPGKQPEEEVVQSMVKDTEDRWCEFVEDLINNLKRSKKKRC